MDFSLAIKIYIPYVSGYNSHENESHIDGRSDCKVWIWRMLSELDCFANQLFNCVGRTIARRKRSSGSFLSLSALFTRSVQTLHLVRTETFSRQIHLHVSGKVVIAVVTLHSP